MEDEAFLRQTESRDAELAKAREIILKIQSGEITAEINALEIVKAKLTDWTEKRNVLLNILIMQLKRGR
jgi:hypothetical protein